MEAAYPRSAPLLGAHMPPILAHSSAMVPGTVAQSFSPEGDLVRASLGMIAQVFSELARSLALVTAGREVEAMLEFCGVFVAAVQNGVDMVSRLNPCPAQVVGASLALFCRAVLLAPSFPLLIA